MRGSGGSWGAGAATGEFPGERQAGGARPAEFRPQSSREAGGGRREAGWVTPGHLGTQSPLLGETSSDGHPHPVLGDALDVGESPVAAHTVGPLTSDRCPVPPPCTFLCGTWFLSELSGCPSLSATPTTALLPPPRTRAAPRPAGHVPVTRTSPTGAWGRGTCGRQPFQRLPRCVRGRSWFLAAFLLERQLPWVPVMPLAGGARCLVA